MEALDQQIDLALTTGYEIGKFLDDVTKRAGLEIVYYILKSAVEEVEIDNPQLLKSFKASKQYD